MASKKDKITKRKRKKRKKKKEEMEEAWRPQKKVNENEKKEAKGGDERR